MTRRILIKLILLTILPLWSVAGEPDSQRSVLAVQSLRVLPYDQAMEGFESVSPGKIHRVFLDENPSDNLQDEIRKIHPDLILAIGLSALTRTMGVKDIPVVYLMVLDPPEEARKSVHITGISMSVSPDAQMDIVRKTLPRVKTLGMVYDPAKDESFVKIAREAAARKNFLLLAIPAESPKDVAAHFKSMKDRMDLFWMIPDTHLLAGGNIEILHLLSLENRIPILSFSEKFTDLGSLISIGIDPFDVGRQAGNLVRTILAEPGSPRTGAVFADKAVVTANWKIGKKLNVLMDSDAMKNLDSGGKRPRLP
jgi:putative tryptophan/tyrosine transport system substrate-binding protein